MDRGRTHEAAPFKSSIWGQMMILVSSRRVSRLGALLLACSAFSAIPASAQRSRWRTEGRPLRNLGRRPRHPRHEREAGRRLRALCRRQVDGRDGDPCRQVAERRRIRARRPQPGAASRRSSPARRRTARSARFYASYMDEARLEQPRRGAAEGGPRPRRRDQDQGRIREPYGFDLLRLRIHACSPPACCPIPRTRP